MDALYNASIPDSPRAGSAPCAFPDVTSSRSGVSVSYAPVPDRRWYVLRILYGQSQRVADALIEDGAYVYLARVWRHVRNRSTGRRQRRLLPFMNLLFAHVTAQDADRYVHDFPESRYTSYYYDHFHERPDGTNPPLTVSPRDMAPLVRATSLHDEHVMQVDVRSCRFLSDDPVRVTDGPFEGVIGRVARVARQNRVVIYIPGLRSGLTTAYIPPYCLERVDESLLSEGVAY